MAGVTWRNLATQAKVEDALVFLNKADIGSVIFGMDDMIIKEGIFSVMKKFQNNADVQNRSLQLLQDCQILSPKGITNDELAFRFDSLLLTLSSCIDRTDVLCNLFEFLAMVADKKAVKERCSRTEDTELLHLVGHSLEIHQKDKHVQRSGLQLYEAILNNATEKGQKVFAKKMFRAVGENLQKNNDDPAICFSSYSILCTLADKMGDKLAPWIERILGMILTTISQLFSGELVAKCMVLLEKLATDQDALYVMAGHPRSLRVFTDALGILDVSHLSASITVLEYFLRILEDDTAVQLVMENIIDQRIKPLKYLKTVKAELDAKADKFSRLVAEANNVDEGAMQYWLQLLDFINNILGDMIRELAAEYPEGESDSDGEGASASHQPDATAPVMAAMSFAADTAEAVEKGVADQRKASSGEVPVVANPLAARKLAASVTTEAAPSPRHDNNTVLADSIASEQARVAQALDAVSAAESAARASSPSSALPLLDGHKRRSFIYEEPDDPSAAKIVTESGSVMGSRKERVVGSSFPSLSAVAAAVTSAHAAPSAGGGPGVPHSTAQVQVAVAAVAVPVGIPGNSSTPPGPKAEIPVVTAVAADRADRAAVDPFGGRSSKNAPLLAGVRWENLEQQFDVIVVEAYLNTCDLGTAILTMDTAIVKGALFTTMRNFPDDAAIQCKCIQMLQECQLLSPKGVSSEELSRHFDLLLHVVSNFTDQPGLIAALFEFLAMVADRKTVKERCCRTEDTELLHYVGKVLEMHRLDKVVQRAGLQLYEAILLHATEKSQKLFAKKIFRAVGENLQKNNDDPAICFSSYSILCTLTDKMGDKLAPWIERILGLVLTSITQLYSAELVAKCLLLLEKLATDHDSLFVMAAHPRCLRVFTDALGILDTKYMSATITALEYLLRILEDDTSMSVVLENLDSQKVAHLEYFRKLQDELTTKSDKFLDHAAQASEVDDGAMQYWLQLLEQINNIIVVYLRELGKDATDAIQEAATPGLLPTIAEHGSGSDDEESIEAFDEKNDGLVPGVHYHAPSGAAGEEMDLQTGGEGVQDGLKEQEEAEAAAQAEQDRLAAETAEAELAAAEEAQRLAEEQEEAEAVAQAEQDRLVAEAAEAVLAAEEEAQRLAEEQKEAQEAARLEAEIAAEEAELAEQEHIANLQRQSQAEAVQLEAQRLADEAAAMEAERLAAEAEEEALILAAEEELRAEEAAVAAEELQRRAEEEAAEAERLANAEAEAQRQAEEEALEAERAAIAAAEAQRLTEEEALEMEKLALAQAEAQRKEEEEALQSEYAAIAAAEAIKLAEEAALEAERRAVEEALSKEEELLRIENQKIVSAQRAAVAEKERLLALQREADESAARIESERLAAAAKVEADRLATEARAAALQAEREEVERITAAARVEEERIAALRAEEEERQCQAVKEAEEAAARAKADKLAAEKLAAEQKIAKLAKEKAAARVAAEKVAKREREAQQAAERAARLAAAEEAKKAVETRRAERLAAEKATKLAAEEKRIAQQREREEKAALEKAARITAAQLALQQAKEKLEREHAEKVAAERAIAQAAEERLSATQRAREEQAQAAQRAKEEQAAADKAARIALAQQAVAEAKEKRQKEIAQKEAAAVVAMAAVSFHLQPSTGEFSNESKVSQENQRSSSGTTHSAHVASDIASEILSSPAPASTAVAPPAPTATSAVMKASSNNDGLAAAESKGLKREPSWRVATVPFASTTVNAQKEAEESKKVQELQKATEEAKRQAQLAIQRAEEMHRLYLGAEKKIENLAVENVQLVQQAQQKAVEATKSTAAANRKQPQSLGQAGYSSVLLKNKGGGGNTGGVSSAQGQGQQRVTSPSPVRSAFTPPGANHSFEPQSTGFFEMDSVQLDLRSPQAAADATTAAPHSADHQHLQQQHQPHAAHPIRSTAVPSSSSISPSKRSLNSHSHSSKYADVSLSRSPVRRSRSVPDMHADKDEVRALDPEEVARRQARAERLRRIVYPVRAQTAERMMQASTAYDEEDNSGKCSKQAQAVEGVLEAFAQLTVPSSAAITGFGSASAKVRHGSLRHPAAAASASVSASSRNSSPEATLHRTNSIYGTGSNNFSSPQPAHSMSMSTPAAEEDDGFFGESPMPPAGSSALYSVKFSPARRDLTSMEAQYCEVVNASTGPAMQECARNIAVLFRRLKENTKNNFNGQSDAVIGLPLMKLCVRRLGLVDGKSFQNNEADILLFHLGVKQLTLFGFALAVTLCAERALHSPLEGELGASTYIPKSYLGVVDFLNEKIIKLFRQMDSEHVQKTAFNPLDDYREISPECQNEVMKLLEREKKVFYAIYESYLPKSVKGFFDMRAALSAAPLSGGLPFSGIVNFGRDFEMSPHLLSRAQLLEIFNSILLAERELVQQALAEADVNASASASGKVHFAPETPAGGKTLSLDTAAPDNQRWSNRKNEFSAHSMSAKGDPAESISFPQFLDFILLVALRCPMFRGASSPVVKLSNLMLLLNQSQGKHKLAKKFRSKELVVFRVNPVFAMAASFSTTGHQSVSSSPMPVGSSGGSGGFSPAAAGFDGTSSHQDIPLDSVERHSVKNPTRSPSPTRRGGNNEIPIAPTTRPFKPSTVPFFDAATQAVVQIRRKKPMTELRGKLSDSY